MNYERRSTEEIARETIQGWFQEIEGYTNPTQDGNLAAWMCAKEQATRLVDTIQTVCDAISARPEMNPGLQALRLIAAEPIPDDMLVPIATPEEEEELNRIERAHPEIFDPINGATPMVLPPQLDKEA